MSPTPDLGRSGSVSSNICYLICYLISLTILINQDCQGNEIDADDANYDK